MLVEKGQPCAGVNDIMPVKQALRETLAESERPYTYKVSRFEISLRFQGSEQHPQTRSRYHPIRTVYTTRPSQPGYLQNTRGELNSLYTPSIG